MDGLFERAEAERRDEGVEPREEAAGASPDIPEPSSAQPVAAGASAGARSGDSPLEDRTISMLVAHAVENVAEAVTITDMNDVFVYVNRAFCRLYGYSREEILGERPTILVPPGAVAEVFPLVTGTTRLGGWKGELTNRTKEGRLFPIQLSTAPILDANGKLVGLVGVTEDITERKRSRDRLQRSEESLRIGNSRLQQILQRQIAILRSTPHGLCMFAPDWSIQYANPSFARMIRGHESEAEDLLGVSFQTFFASIEEFHAFRVWARKSVSADAENVSRRLELMRTDGTPLWCEMSIVRSNPYQTDSGHVATFVDKSERSRDRAKHMGAGSG